MSKNTQKPTPSQQPTAYERQWKWVCSDASELGYIPIVEGNFMFLQNDLLGRAAFSNNETGLDDLPPV